MGKFVPISQEVYERATERGNRLAPLRAVAAKYIGGQDRLIMIEMSTGLRIAFDPQKVRGLKPASIADVKDVQVVGAGWTLYFPRLDEYLSIPQLVADLGLPDWAKRESRAIASRKNGSLGGRPRKAASAA